MAVRLILDDIGGRNNVARIAVQVTEKYAKCMQGNCGREHLEFKTVGSDVVANWFVGVDGDEIRATLGEETRTVLLASQLSFMSQHAAWTVGIPMTELADPCLVALATTLGITVTVLSVLISYSVSTHEDYCQHTVIVNDCICTTLVIGLRLDASSRYEVSEALNGNTRFFGRFVGLVNLVDLFGKRIDVEGERLSVERPIFPVPTHLLEASPQEEAMSLSTLLGLSEWRTTDCTSTLSERREWGHIIFVSHAWSEPGVPGTPADLSDIQRAVSRYVDTVLAEVRRGNISATVKNVNTPDDFGIWIDYMLVPNNRDHISGCTTCQQHRREQIAKISAILTVSTIIVMSPQEYRRGWILHELTTNSHGNVLNGRNIREDQPLETLAGDLRRSYLDRVNLMASTTFFTNGNDGRALRIYEFVRMGQLPRTWPAVNSALLDAWRAAAVTDERSIEARPILLDYARHFDRHCHLLKRLMVDLQQQLASSFIPRSEVERDPERVLNTTFLFERQAPIDLRILAAAIQDQQDAMLRLNMPTATEAAVLQLQQFIAVSMGARAEWLNGAGFASWLRASLLTSALAASKSSARLYNGQPDVRPASCIVSLGLPVETQADRAEFAAQIMRSGVSALVLNQARLFSRPPAQLARFLSGKTLVTHDS